MISRIENIQDKDVKLEDIGTSMTDVHVGIRPMGGKHWYDITYFEAFLEENQIILEGNELEFQGSGRIIDPTTGASERISFHAPMSTCQIVASLGEEYA